MRIKLDAAQLPPRPTLDFEQSYWATGLKHVAGIDEAGRGPLAGPVVAAAVILPPDPAISEALRGVRDSKQMTPSQREYWAVFVKAFSLTYGVGHASSAEIDDLGILPATHLAATRAINQLAFAPQALLLDYLILPDQSIPQTPLVKGDARSLSIAAASILAKTARDTMLGALERLYPGYGFASHKGYGTPAHLEALACLGPSPIHRLTFNPLKGYCKQVKKEI
jgi:ribonuclease HII